MRGFCDVSSRDIKAGLVILYSTKKHAIELVDALCGAFLYSIREVIYSEFLCQSQRVMINCKQTHARALRIVNAKSGYLCAYIEYLREF